MKLAIIQKNVAIRLWTRPGGIRSIRVGVCSMRTVGRSRNYHLKKRGDIFSNLAIDALYGLKIQEKSD